MRVVAGRDRRRPDTEDDVDALAYEAVPQKICGAGQSLPCVIVHSKDRPREHAEFGRVLKWLCVAAISCGYCSSRDRSIETTTHRAYFATRGGQVVYTRWQAPSTGQSRFDFFVVRSRSSRRCANIRRDICRGSFRGNGRIGRHRATRRGACDRLERAARSHLRNRPIRSAARNRFARPPPVGWRR